MSTDDEEMAEIDRLAVDTIKTLSDRTVADLLLVTCAMLGIVLARCYKERPGKINFTIIKCKSLVAMNFALAVKGALRCPPQT